MQEETWPPSLTLQLGLEVESPPNKTDWESGQVPHNSEKARTIIVRQICSFSGVPL